MGFVGKETADSTEQDRRRGTCKPISLFLYVLTQYTQVNHQLFTDDGLISHKRSTPVKQSLDVQNPVTEEARYRMQLEDEFLNFDYSQHQMAEQDNVTSFLEQRRSSLKRQYDRFKRRSMSSSYSEPYSD